MVTKRYVRDVRGAGLWLWDNVAPGVFISLILVLMVAAGGETYLRLRVPFTGSIWLARFDPRVGYIVEPGAEVATTNNFDYWTRQRANSIGFLDREPVPSERRTDGCHLVFIGDSFVEAHQVTIDKKVQVVLETLAAKELPSLKLTTAAFGQSDTGQINQLAYYDHFARAQKPNVVVLVAVKNDFSDNSVTLQAINHGRDPDHMPRLVARRTSDESFVLQPIDLDWSKYMLARPIEKPPTEANKLNEWIKQHSLIYRWLVEASWRVVLFVERKVYGQTAVMAGQNPIVRNAHILAQRPQFASVLDDWNPETQPAIDEVFFEERLPKVFHEALDFTGFALDQFQERARRDGFKLLILATQTLKRESGSDRPFKLLKELADKRGIPVIDLYAHIEAQNGRISDARLLGDGHWSPQGHKWAAEAVLKYLADHQDLCR